MQFLSKELKVKEDHKLSNIILVLGYFSCFFAAFTHTYPLPFSQSIAVITAFVVIYGIISAYFTYVETFITNTRIFKSQKSKNGEYFEIHTALPKYSDIYTLTIKKISGGKVTQSQIKESIANWFYANGNLCQNKYSVSLLSAAKQFK